MPEWRSAHEIKVPLALVGQLRDAASESGNQKLLKSLLRYELLIGSRGSHYAEVSYFILAHCSERSPSLRVTAPGREACLEEKFASRAACNALSPSRFFWGDRCWYSFHLLLLPRPSPSAVSLIREASAFAKHLLVNRAVPYWPGRGDTSFGHIHKTCTSCRCSVSTTSPSLRSVPRVSPVPTSLLIFGCLRPTPLLALPRCLGKPLQSLLHTVSVRSLPFTSSLRRFLR